MAYVQDACRSLSREDNYTLTRMSDRYGHILCDDQNRVLFCAPPKTGSSFFKRLWLKYTRNVTNEQMFVHEKTYLRKYNLRYLSTYSQSEQKTRLQTYFKFMLARHPMLRVLSTYREKLERNNTIYRQTVGRRIEKKYGRHDSALPPKGDNVTFEQFVHYIVDNNPLTYEHHWKPVSFLCHPCEIRYDYIAKLETSNVDYLHIFSHVQTIPDSKRQLLKSTAEYKASTDNDRVRRYYGRIPANHIDSLERIYHLDLNLFGYTWNTTLLSYGCQVTARDNDTCC